MRIRSIFYLKNETQVVGFKEEKGKKQNGLSMEKRGRRGD